MIDSLSGNSASTSLRYETKNLAFAGFLIASRHLRYAGLRVENNRGIFVFDDPLGQGPSLESEFRCGAECSAEIFHNVIRRLRREIDSAIARDGGAR